jgi:dihydropteroate synthase
MNYSINIGGKILRFDEPKIMGILNITNDSFYSGSRLENRDQILQSAAKMLDDGADILDIGGYSTRPGADDIPVEKEIDRVVPAIEEIRKEFPDSVISVDTFRSQVLKAAHEAGADICNDVSGGNLDEQMFETVGQLKIPYILMHMKGNPQTMKGLTEYDDLVLEMIEYFKDKIDRLNEMGIYDIIIDPGFGFAKTADQNFYLLRQLGAFKIFELPVLAGLSRKSMIYKTLNTTAEEAINGTTALNMLALVNGANLLRVHDVKEAKQTIELYSRYNSDRIY